MRKTYTLFALLAPLVLVGACSTFQNTTVPTVKAQQAVDLAVSAYKVDLDAENIYLKQPPCGLAGSPPAPLCASYAVGVQWKAADEKVKKAITDTQTAINTVGTNPKVLDAAVAAMQLVLSELNNFTNVHKVAK